MTLNEIEVLLQKTIGIDCDTYLKIIILIYENEDYAIDVYDVLTTQFPFTEELTIHIDYKEFVNVAIVSKSTADTLTIKNVKYFEGKSTYVQLMGLIDISKPTDRIFLHTATLMPNGEYTIPYLDKGIPDVPLLNVIGLSRKFINSEDTL